MDDNSEDEFEENFGELDDEIVPDLEAVHEELIEQIDNPSWTKNQLNKKTNRSKFTDEISISMLPKKQTPVFPTPPNSQEQQHMPPTSAGVRRRCSSCTTEVGYKKAKRSYKVCQKCQKPTCQTHFLIVCKFCDQN